MAECCEVMVAHGPPKPLFTAAGRRAAQPELVFYQNLRLVVAQKQSSPMAARRYNGGSRASAPSSPTTEECGRQACQPRRPCLVVRADSDGSIGSSSSGSSSDENELASPTRRKKKVVFADDRGLSLTQVSTFLFYYYFEVEEGETKIFLETRTHTPLVYSDLHPY